MSLSCQTCLCLVGAVILAKEGKEGISKQQSSRSAACPCHTLKKNARRDRLFFPECLITGLVESGQQCLDAGHMVLLLLQCHLVAPVGCGLATRDLQNERVVQIQIWGFALPVWDARALICVISLVRCHTGLFIPWGCRQAKLLSMLLAPESG